MKRSLYQAVCVSLPKGLGGLLTIVLNGVLLTRMTAAEFGVYALCLLICTLADGVIGSAVDMSAVKLASVHRLQDSRRSAAIEQWAALIKIGFGLLLLLALSPWLAPLSTALFHREDPLLLALALIVAVGVLAMRSVALNMQLAQRFEAYAGLELWAQTLRVVGILAVLQWWQPSALALTLASVAGTTLAVLGGLRIARLGWPAAPLRWADGRELLVSLRWMLATFALSAIYVRLDLLALTRWSGIEQVGLFAAAQVFAFVPELFGMWVAVVFSGRVLPSHADGSLRPLMRRVQGSIASLAVVAALLTWLLLQWLPAWMPAAFVRSTDILWPLLLGALAGMVALPVTVPFVMFSRPGFILSYDLVSLPLLVLAYYWAIQHFGAVGAAWVSAVSRIIKSTALQACAWVWAQPGPRATLSMQ
ncbi:lipopolysaccharide biosynthesis protein [Roseateles sp. P5_E7]